MKSYYDPTDQATAAFIAEAHRHAEIRKRERRATALAASSRRWPAIPWSIVRRAIDALDCGSKQYPGLVSAIAKIRWNHSYGTEERLIPVASVLSRMAARN